MTAIMFCHQIYVGILLYRITHHLVDPKHKFVLPEAAFTDCCPTLSRSFEWRAVIGSAFVGHQLARARSDSRSVLKLQAPAAVVSRDARLRFL